MVTTRPLHQLQVLPAESTPHSVAQAIHDDGCVVVDRLVAPELMDAVLAETALAREAGPVGGDDFTGPRTKRTGSLVARSETFRTIAVHPLVTTALDRVLGKGGARYQMHLSQVIDIGPGESAQMVHRDHWAFNSFPWPLGFEVECHVMWALTDFTEANGATRLMPGSHLWPDNVYDHDIADTIPAEMAKGSVLFFLGSLYHAGGTNRAATHRLGLNVGYTLAWLRQEENQYLACPPELACNLPEELARLIGYQQAAPGLGYVGDLEDPYDYITGRRRAQQTFLVGS